MKCLSQCHINRIYVIYAIYAIGEKSILKVVGEGDYANFDIKIVICKIHFKSLC